MAGFRDRKQTLQDILDKSLEHLNDDREVDFEGLSKRKRVNQSLQKMDDKSSWSLYDKINKCREYQKARRFKERLSSAYYGQLDIPDPYSDTGFREYNPFRDEKGYIERYTKRKEVCQSLWCPNCRKYLTEIHRKRVTDRLNNPNVNYQNSDFRHITGVLGLSSVNDKDLKYLIKIDGKRWGRIRHRLRSKIAIHRFPFIEIAFEYELVNWTFLRASKTGSPHKISQIRQLRKHHREVTDEVFIYAHFHGVTNLTPTELEQVFDDEYFIDGKPLTKTNRNTGLYIQKFRSCEQGVSGQKILENNLTKICSYPFKDTTRFKHSFIGSDYKNGEPMGPYELGSLINVYQKVQGRNWTSLLKSIDNPESEEIRDNALRYPPEHPVWNHLPTLTNMDISEPPILVNEVGVAFQYGWNPEWLMEDRSMYYDLTQMVEKASGKVKSPYKVLYSDTPRGDPPTSTGLNAMRDQFEERTIKKPITLRDLYFPRETGYLGRGEYFDWRHIGLWVFGVRDTGNPERVSFTSSDEDREHLKKAPKLF